MSFCGSARCVSCQWQCTPKTQAGSLRDYRLGCDKFTLPAEGLASGGLDLEFSYCLLDGGKQHGVHGARRVHRDCPRFAPLQSGPIAARAPNACRSIMLGQRAEQRRYGYSRQSNTRTRPRAMARSARLDPKPHELNGERKADSACACGLVCVRVPGGWTWECDELEHGRERWVGALRCFSREREPRHVEPLGIRQSAAKLERLIG